MTTVDATTGALSERQVLAAATRLMRGLRAELGEPAAVPDTLPAHPGEVADLLRRTAETAIDRLDRHGEQHPTADELTDIAVSALDLEAEMRRHICGRQARRRGELERYLARLRRVQDPTELSEQTCEAAARGCGVQRVLLSRVRDGVWSPWKLHDSHGIDAATAAWMGTTAIALEDLPLEATVSATGRAATVTDAAGDERVHQPLRRLMQWESFVVAPIAPAGQVLGLLHADRLTESRSVDDDDRDLLWAFAEGLGRIHERATVLERFESQRTLIREATVATESIMSSLHGEIDLVRLVGRQQPPSANTDDLSEDQSLTALDEQLTPRERDVLTLMLKGHANAAIAERLAVTRSTVKSHVRSILRKLGAVNRAEAISRYHDMTKT
jgi:DNA-binding CsgD family transcriptional regulator